jgi:biopolymer transport protein TolR
MTGRRPRRMMNQINVVPYIDVMLVLLVIFMITAPLISPGQIELPSIAKSPQAPAAPIEITLKSDLTLTYVDREAGAKETRVNLDELLAAIVERQKANPEHPVVIGADKSVRYEEVVRIIDRLQGANVKKVGLLVKPRTS